MFRLTATINYPKSQAEKSMDCDNDLALLSAIRGIINHGGKVRASSFVFTVVRVEQK